MILPDVVLPTRPTAILLDWDGTIWDSLPRLHAVQSGVCAELGLPALTPAQSHESTRYGGRIDQVLGLDSATGNRAFALFAERFFVFDGVVSLLPHAGELIAALPPELPLGIVSANDGALLRAQIDAVGWTARIGATVAQNEAPRNKPHPDPALLALQQLGVAPNNKVWFVGDGPGDMACAAAASLTGIFIGPTRPDYPVDFHFTDCRPLRQVFA